VNPLRKSANFCANAFLAFLTWALGDGSSDTAFKERQRKRKRGLRAANKWENP
jgi:hypothetical protein